MREVHAINVALALCLTSVGSSVPSAASADDKVTRVQYLVQDIKAHIAECGAVNPDTHPTSPACANEQAELVNRQVELGLSNAAVNAQLSGTRGPNGWDPKLP